MSDTPPLIERGQRAPDFALPRGPGAEPTRFYGVVGGRPTVVVLAGRDATVAAEVSTRLSHARQDVDVHVVTQDPDGPDGVFQDVDGRVHTAFGAPVDLAVAVVLDANVRVTGTVEVGDVDAAVAAIDRYTAPAASSDDAATPRHAPVLLVPNALASSLRAELMERWRTHGSVETGVETVVDGARAEATDVRHKRRRDHTVTDRALLRRLTQHVGARVFPELRKAFVFDAGGFEGFKVGCYAAEDAGFFRPHRDNLSAGTAHRRFGLSLNLNDEYEGGELCFPEYGGARYRPAAGEALVFSGSHLHEVLPVRDGRRFVLLSFVLSRPNRSG